MIAKRVGSLESPRMMKHGRRPLTATLAAFTLAALALLAAGGSVVNAQPRCPEGRTAAGDCVDPNFAVAQRQAAVIFSQPKLSYTAFPILPVQDRTYRYPNELIPDFLRPSGGGGGTHCGGPAAIC
jgi:hypothetical protein